jgi:putative DNA primase/helicase
VSGYEGSDDHRDDQAPDPDLGAVDATLPAPSEPMAVARTMQRHWQLDGHFTLRHWRGGWMRWQKTHWVEADDREVRADMYRRTEHAQYLAGGKAPESKPWAPTRRKITDLLEAVAAVTHLSASLDPPVWTAGALTTGPVVACSNGLLDVPTRKLLDLDPRYFTLVSVPFDYDPAAPAPERWLKFLAELWPEDEESVTLLQEFFGYVISGRTHLHKILLIVGPTRSGKGTIARVLHALLGRGNVAGPTLASLGGQFGLSPLLGKPLAVIADARLGDRSSEAVVERLLTISGEDTVDVDRKFRDPWTGRLPTRFVILSNELPSFGDASGTIAHRFLILQTGESWLGREDTTLDDVLAAELPGILNWALEGLARLDKRRRFAEPAVSRAAVTTMKDSASPTSAFIRERCKVGRDESVRVDELWSAWRAWCEDNGRGAGNKQTFRRNLTSVIPSLRDDRPRIDGVQHRVYLGLTLCTAGNGESQGSPGSSGSVPAQEAP